MTKSVAEQAGLAIDPAPLPPHRSGHRYALSDYGLTEAMVHQRMAAYMARYF